MHIFNLTSLSDTIKAKYYIQAIKYYPFVINIPVILLSLFPFSGLESLAHIYEHFLLRLRQLSEQDMPKKPAQRKLAHKDFLNKIEPAPISELNFIL